MDDVQVTGAGIGEDSPVRQAALEAEAHVDEGGWDQAPRLFALVSTAALLAAQPELSDRLGDSGEYTPVEQELPPGQDVETLLPQIGWPDQVDGCAVVMERVTLPAEVEAELPEDPAEAAEFAAGHPRRQEMRIVAAALRDGSAHVAVRPRVPADAPLIEGPGILPDLVTMLLATLVD